MIVNRLNKTKVEKEVDHEEVRQERLREAGRLKKAEAIETVSILLAIPAYLFRDFDSLLMGWMLPA
jgi:hypothetical protein